MNGYFGRRIEGYHKDVSLGTFEFKEREIDFIRAFKKTMKASLCKELVELIQEKVVSFKDESKNFRRGYTGIAPIPFAALAGTCLKREKIDEYFEYDKIKTETFYKLQKGKAVDPYPTLELKTNLGQLNPQSKEIVLAVSVTRRILERDLQQFQNIAKVMLSIDKPVDNAIKYQAQLFEYREKIVTLIEDLRVYLPHLEKVHLVCSCQSCLALEIGKKMEDQRMVQVIVYQFNAQNPEKKYPWGIVINGTETGLYIEG